MKILIVTGGRDFTDIFLVRTTLKDELPFDQVWHGGAAGADTLGGSVATDLGKQVAVFAANWQAHGKSAGPLRNRAMLTAGKAMSHAGHEVVVLAFPGGTGTAHAVATATELGLKVVHATHPQAPLL